MPARSFIVQLSDTARSLEATTPITKSHVESQYVSVKYLTILGKKTEQQSFLSQREGTMNKCQAAF